jgi:murein DD-endopeptidase MepM/ murein hydrolase activator NlpD
MTKVKKKGPSRLKKRFRLVLMNDSTFEEEWSFRLSLGNIVYGLSFLVILLVVSGGLLMTFTPLKQWIPDYPDAKIRQGIIDNSIKADSLFELIRIQDQFITNLKQILAGNVKTDLPSLKSLQDSRSDIIDSLNQREYDSIIREKVEFDRKTSVSVIQNSETSANIATLQFFPPVRGVVSNVFNAKEQHFGIDIVTKPQTLVCAALSGTIIYKGWTLEGGNVIQIQHTNNIITVYKHNATILKNQGDYVLVGEPIAIVGNTGEYSTGPHLHFEMWYNGVPVNPADYVSFN